MAKPRSGKKRTLEPGISDEQYRLIGGMITEWARLETALGSLIWHFLKLDMEDGRIVTATMDARSKTRMLRQFGKRYVKPKADRELFIKLLGVAEDLSEDRNFIAHGIWGTAMPENVPSAASLRPRTNPFHVVVEPFPAKKMRNLISITCDLTDLFLEMPDELSASQKKHAERLLRLRTNRKRVRKDRSP